MMHEINIYLYYLIIITDIDIDQLTTASKVTANEIAIGMKKFFGLAKIQHRILYKNNLFKHSTE